MRAFETKICGDQHFVALWNSQDRTIVSHTGDNNSQAPPALRKARSSPP
jgi:hypothetical protein